MDSSSRRLERVRQNQETFQRVQASILALESPGGPDLSDPSGDAWSDEVTRRIQHGQASLAEYPFWCECGREQCDEVIDLDVIEYRHIRSEPDYFVVRPGHERRSIELRSLLSGRDRFWVVQCMRPPSRKPLDTKTLELECASMEKEIEDRMKAFDTIRSQMAAGAGSGVLILGIFTALRPQNGSGLSAILLAFALLPFLGLMISSLFGPTSLTDDLERRLYPSWEDRWAAEREYQATPGLEAIGTPVSMATYEQVDRMEAAQAEAGPHGVAEVLLPAEDWLIFRIHTLQRRLIALRAAIRKATTKREAVTVWLGLLVVYLVGITIAAPFID